MKYFRQYYWGKFSVFINSLFTHISNIMFDSFFLLVGHFFNYLVQLLLLVINLTPFMVVELSGVKMKEFVKNVKNASSWGNREPKGLIMGMWFIGDIQVTQNQRGNETSKMILIILRKQFDRMNGIHRVFDEESQEFVEQNDPQYYFYDGHYWDSTCPSMPLKVPQLTPTPQQSRAVEEIVNRFNMSKSNNVVAILHGPAGTGKSSVAYCLVNHLLNMEKKKDVSLIDTFNPTEPNVFFNRLYTQTKTSIDKPLIVLMDEVDILWQLIYCGKVQPHNEMRTMIQNKIDWNRFFDHINEGRLYRGVIILMTTNQSMEFFDSRDPAYFRTGRVDLRIAM